MTSYLIRDAHSARLPCFCRTNWKESVAKKSQLARSGRERMKARGTALSRRATILLAAFFVTSTIASGQALTPEHTSEISQALFAAQSDISPPSHSLFLLSPLKSQTLETSYRLITPTQRFRWFVTGTMGPAHIAGAAFVSACGTAVNRPTEYGPHWKGFANRFGMGGGWQRNEQCDGSECRPYPSRRSALLSRAATGLQIPRR